MNNAANTEATMGRFAVWGRGISSSTIVRGGEYTDRAASLAGEHGFGGPGEMEDTWYVEVECDEDDLDAQTRSDGATVGYCTIARTTATLKHGNDEITMTVETTVAACGLDPSTDGSCDGSDPVRLVCSVYWSEDRRRTRDIYRVDALGMTLRDVAAGRDPSWLECDGIEPKLVWQALDRVLPGWDDVKLAAEWALEAEHETTDDDEWMEVQERERAEVDAKARAIGIDNV